MYLSKIWFVVVAAIAAIALTLALVMPRPAERQASAAEARQLQRACSVARILLRDNARTRVQLAGEFARAAAPANQPSLRLDSILYNASKGEIVSGQANATGRQALSKLLESFHGNKPDFVWLLDRRGRVVAQATRAGKGDDRYGESVAGYYLVDDALAGYLRDDLWIRDGKLYRVAASPVVTRQLDWAGAVIVGHAIDKSFADSLAEGLDVQVGFYAGGKEVASSASVPIDKQIMSHLDAVKAIEPGRDCLDGEPFSVSAQGTTYSAMIARLPGEAGEVGAFYTVFAEHPEGLGFGGTFALVRKDDLSFSNFPWIPVALLFLLMVGGGMFLMVWESDRPLKRLTEDSQLLGKGESERLREEVHGGKHGSIARSINVALDRLRREAKSARKDLDDLLGPAPAAGSSPLPMSTPAGLAPQQPPPPPPSEFKFSDSSRMPQPAAAAPPPERPTTPRPVSLPGSPRPASRAPSAGAPRAGSGAIARPGSVSAPPVISPVEEDDLKTTAFEPDADLDEEPPTLISDRPQELAVRDAENQHFRQIFEEFLATKRRCGEAADNLTFEKFAAKLRKNRDALKARHGCRSVRFQVYVKDGKAALKASPVR